MPSLDAQQPVTIDQKFIALGFATEDRMVVEHQACLAFASLALKDQRGSETADAAANNHAIVCFASIDRSS